MDNQERNREALIDHIAEQDRIIRRRNEQIAAQVEIIEEARRDLADYQAMHSRQIETIARTQKTVRKAVEKVQVREGAMNRLGARAEKAEQERDSVQAALVCAIQENDRLADFLAERGVRVTGGQS